MLWFKETIQFCSFGFFFPFEKKLTSIVQLLFSLVLFPCNNGIPSMKSGRFPSFVMKKSPLLRNLMVPCRRDTLCAGPSNVKSTSTLS